MNEPNPLYAEVVRLRENNGVLMNALQVLSARMTNQIRRSTRPAVTVVYEWYEVVNAAIAHAGDGGEGTKS
jgi:hypothetical protein